MFDVLNEGRDRNSLATLQVDRMRMTLTRVSQVPFYRQRLEAKNVSPERFGKLADLKHLPFTTKQDLRDQYPLGLLAVPRTELARIHATSGTSGRPILMGYTQRDLQTWGQLCARLLHAAGLRRCDGIHNALNYGLFTGGLGIHNGIEALGGWAIPASGGHSLRQIQLIQDLGPAGIKSTPSYMLHLADVAEQAGIDPGALGLRSAILGAEPWSESLRQAIETRWKLTAYDSYGLSEMFGPGVAFECEMRDGLHVMEDHFIPEIINPHTGRPVHPGEEGELVLTSLTKEAMPLLRYRTGDQTALMEEPCRCGRTSFRLRRIRGRVDDMLIVRGVNLFPSEIERVLLRHAPIHSHYVLIIERPAALDHLTIRAEMKPGHQPDDTLAEQVSQDLKADLGLNARIELLLAGTLPRQEGTKAVRVIDRRKEHG